jgi:Zn-dependent peptidase ImmA (M78 family)
MRRINPNGDAIGLAFGQDLTIFIASWVHPRLQRETLLHELMHACVFGAASDSIPADDTDHEEHFVSGLDAPLLATLRDNPDLVRYLTE